MCVNLFVYFCIRVPKRILPLFHYSTPLTLSNITSPLLPSGESSPQYTRLQASYSYQFSSLLYPELLPSPSSLAGLVFLPSLLRFRFYPFLIFLSFSSYTDFVSLVLPHVVLTSDSSFCPRSNISLNTLSKNKIPTNFGSLTSLTNINTKNFPVERRQTSYMICPFLNFIPQDNVLTKSSRLFSTTVKLISTFLYLLKLYIKPSFFLS